MKLLEKNQKCDENIFFKEYKDPTNCFRRKMRMDIDQENRRLLNMRSQRVNTYNNSPDKNYNLLKENLHDPVMHSLSKSPENYRDVVARDCQNDNVLTAIGNGRKNVSKSFDYTTNLCKPGK